LKAGHSFKQGLQAVVDEGHPPANQEFKRVLTEAFERAKTILSSQRDVLDRLAAALLERETLDREDVDLVVAGRPLPPVPPTAPAAAAPPPAADAAKDKAAPRGPVLGSPPPEPAGA